MIFVVLMSTSQSHVREFTRVL